MRLHWHTMKMQFSLHHATALVLLGLSLPALGQGRTCEFATMWLGGAQGLSIGFGSLDPSLGGAVTWPVVAASTNARRIGDCVSSSTMVLTADNGQHFSGTRRLRHATVLTEFIPYTLVGLPISQPGPGNNNYVNFTFSGNIGAGAYTNARAGDYADSVTVSVTP